MFGKRNNPVAGPVSGAGPPPYRISRRPPARRPAGGAGQVPGPSGGRGGELDSRLAEIKLNVFNT